MELLARNSFKMVEEKVERRPKKRTEEKEKKESSKCQKEMTNLE
jgi:hypothetical protein